MGFSVSAIPSKKKGGRPLQWNFDRLRNLCSDVEATKARFKIETDREALSRLARTRKWSPPANHRGTIAQWIETLESRLHQGRDLAAKDGEDRH